MLQPFAQRLDSLSGRLGAAGAERVAHYRRCQGEMAARLEALSPLKVLSRGYAMTLREGKPVVSATQSGVGDRLELIYHDGRLQCEVIEKEDAVCLP